MAWSVEAELDLVVLPVSIGCFEHLERFVSVWPLEGAQWCQEAV